MHRFLEKREAVVWSCVSGDEPNPEKYVVFDGEKLPCLPDGRKHGRWIWGDIFVREELWSFGELQHYSCDGPSLFTECSFRGGMIQKLSHCDKAHKKIAHDYDGYGRVTKVEYFSFGNGSSEGVLEFLWSENNLVRSVNGEITESYSSIILKKNTSASSPMYLYNGVPFLDGVLAAKSSYLEGERDGVWQRFMFPYMAFLDKFH
uniref:Uncharacterized protein n=1 Tax=Marseillevirus sp. TaxID=2809551 RepID=A0AA96EQH8_9VIRU|nr:hypothetical protein MarDSR_439 [Marseillevirus sp.]